MTITVEELRRKYPNPKVGALPVTEVDMGDRYCVGGALCVAAGWWNMETEGSAFPTYTYVATVLRHANPKLDEAEAEFIANRVTCANDIGQFDEAWAWLDKGLSA